MGGGIVDLVALLGETGLIAVDQDGLRSAPARAGRREWPVQVTHPGSGVGYPLAALSSRMSQSTSRISIAGGSSCPPSKSS